MKIDQWLADNSIAAEIVLQDRVYRIANINYLVIEGVKGRILGQDSLLMLNEDDIDLMDQYQIDSFAFLFGDRFYYVEESDLEFREEFDIDLQEVVNKVHVKIFHPLRYLGDCSIEMKDLDMPFLGIHGEYDVCNGSRSYKDWIKKAKFLGIKTLGICEQATLTGTLFFQKECQKNDIKSIIGVTLGLLYDEKMQNFKLYAMNDEGWRNLTHINFIVNNGERSLNIDDLIDHQAGLKIVTGPTCSARFLKHISESFQNCYYQLDFVEWKNDNRDKEWLMSIQMYLKNFRKTIKPIIITDSYYLEKEDSRVQNMLWNIGKRNILKYHSDDRHFKTNDEILEQAMSLFKDKDLSIIDEAIDNTIEFVEDINFIIPTGQKYLPQYKMKPQEIEEHGDSEGLLMYLIEKGLQERVIDKGIDDTPYYDRIEEELRVIKLGGVQDYFLIVWDILNFCKENGILTGIGRGSAAGCMISYLLGIVQVDPLQYGLLFERFLNEGRVGKSLPDIDNDIAGQRREEVKRYMEERYGVEHVAGIGTYGTFKIRAGIKDLIRELGGEAMEANYISSIIEDSDDFYSLINKALNVESNKRLYQFVQKHAYQINHLPLIFESPKTQSVHAAGVIIVPEEIGHIDRQLPVKKMNGIVITEWEGELLDEAGFLKVDILGLKQLDKFTDILDLIEQNTGERIDLNSIPLDDAGVYSYFQQGYNEDVFQFGGGGLRGYCKELKPETIDDLIATVALYRPGPIEIGAHTKYAEIKNGLAEPDFQFGLEEITANTYSTIVYQEQIMLIVQSLGGFTLVEADDIRKAMGKKLPEVMAKYKGQFIKGAVERGAVEEDAERIWMDMEGFAGYAFNKSHATCYAITGYYCQWFKYHYPLEFWMTSLKYSDTDKIPAKIAEIKNIASSLDIVGPDINMSKEGFRGDVSKQKIYWSLSSISYVGESAVRSLFAIREQYGEFLNLNDFLEKVQEFNAIKKINDKEEGKRFHNAINTTCIANLITCGAFDEIEGIEYPKERFELIKRYFQHQHAVLQTDPNIEDLELWTKKIGEKYIQMREWKSDYIWILEQKRLCEFGALEFRDLLPKEFPKYYFMTNMDVNSAKLLEKEKKVAIGSIVSEIKYRNSRNGKFAQLIVSDGTQPLHLTIWNEIYEEYKEEIDNCVGKIIFINGVIVNDSFKNCNVIHSKSWTKLKFL